MLKEERQKIILEVLAEEQKVISSELSKRLNVSKDTIRRDLDQLNKSGLLKRVHSGALRVGPPVTTFSTRKKISSLAKENLAKAAVALLKEDTVIIIDGGTTNLEIIKHLPIDFNGTIITNSPPIANELENHHDVEVIMLGGILHKSSMVNLGIDTYTALQTIQADVYIMGIFNIDKEFGVSVPTLTEARIKRKMMDVSAETIGLVTSDKLGTVSKNIVANFDSLDYLITESNKIYGYQGGSNNETVIIEV